jgi:hypothetical protein
MLGFGRTENARMYVASETLHWENSTLLTGDVAHFEI